MVRLSSLSVLRVTYSVYKTFKMQHSTPAWRGFVDNAGDSSGATRESGIHDDFVCTHLSTAPEGWVTSVDDRLLAVATSDSAARNSDLYVPLASVMTKLSKRIHGMCTLAWLDFVR